MSLMTGCVTHAPATRTVVDTGCSWVLPLYLSEPSIKALRAATTEPAVRKDREAIVAHNRAYERHCGEHRSNPQ